MSKSQNILFLVDVLTETSYDMWEPGLVEQ